jgi:hypothetical protein
LCQKGPETIDVIEKTGTNRNHLTFESNRFGETKHNNEHLS